MTITFKRPKIEQKLTNLCLPTTSEEEIDRLLLGIIPALTRAVRGETTDLSCDQREDILVILEICYAEDNVCEELIKAYIEQKHPISFNMHPLDDIVRETNNIWCRTENMEYSTGFIVDGHFAFHDLLCKLLIEEANNYVAMM